MDVEAAIVEAATAEAPRLVRSQRLAYELARELAATDGPITAALRLKVAEFVATEIEHATSELARQLSI